MVRCVWVLAGAPEPPAAALNLVPQPDKVVVADGGSALAVELGLIPDLMVGDFDSIEPGLLAQWRGMGVAFEKYEHHVKVETDTELAALAALRWKPQEVIILGALGGRLDHALANVLLLTHPQLVEQRVTILEGGQQVFLARRGEWNEMSGRTGDLISLLPIGGDALGVTTEGLEYPLSGETLLRGRGRGVSNRLLASAARVRLDAGLLLVVASHAAD